MKMNSKDLEILKTEIEVSSALQVGYYTTVVGDIIKEMGDDFLTEVLASTLGESIVKEAREGRSAEAMNLFVTEAVRQMTYEEFQNIAHNFFSYRQEKNEIIAKVIEPTEELHQSLSVEEVTEQEKSTKKVTTKELVEWMNALEIVDIEWDVNDPELRGLYADEIPENKKKYERSTIGEALDGFDYGILTGADYKEKFASELEGEDDIEPWTVEEGHNHYPILDVPDDFMVLLDLTEPMQPFYLGKNYKELLNEMNTLLPFGDLTGNRNPSEDGWDREVDFEFLKEIIEEAKYEKEGFTSEEFLKEIDATSFYLLLEETAFSSLDSLNDEQLTEILDAQERQLHATREEMDRAAYEIIEEGADINDLDDWVKDFKVEISNLRQILSEQLKRSERKQEKERQEKIEPSRTRSVKI